MKFKFLHRRWLKIEEYIAFTDESRQNKGRYRSISMIVISKEQYNKVDAILNKILLKYGIAPKKFKWNQFNSRDKVNALKEFLDYFFKLMSNNTAYINTIIWDIHDSRHEILKRDDKKNLSLMYYKLIKNFAEDKLKNGDILTIYPDRTTSIDWKEIEEILPNDGIYNTKKLSFYILGYSKVFIEESNTDENPLIQIADIFAGLARTSYEDFNKYEKWLNRGQQSLFPDENLNDIELSGREEHRFKIYNFIDKYCKHKSWTVSLKTSKGFNTFNKSKPLNFGFTDHSMRKIKPQQNQEEVIKMIEFITNNFIAISNFAMAIATALMAYYSKKSIDEMKISRKEANKANIVFYVEQKEFNLNFIIKNIGNTMAKDVKIRSDPEFKYDAEGEFNFDSIFKSVIPSFPPGFEIKFSFNDTLYLLNEEENLIYNIYISFKDIYDETIEEEFIIDFNYLNGLFMRIPNDVDTSLHNINRNIIELKKENTENVNKLISAISKLD